LSRSYVDSCLNYFQICVDGYKEDWYLVGFCCLSGSIKW
jgi:hypothetical protein